MTTADGLRFYFDGQLHGGYVGPIGVTDGEHVLYHYPPDLSREGLSEYTLVANHMTAPFTIEELRTAQLHPGFDFTKRVPVLKIDARRDAKRVPHNDGKGLADPGTRLYDLKADPQQRSPIEDVSIAENLYRLMIAELKVHDTPAEVYRWYQLEAG